MNQPNAERIFRLPGIHELSKQQDAALSLSLEGQHLIIGGPGTGKSVVALLRARRLAKAKSAYTFLVYNHVLNRSNAQFSGGEFQLDASTWDTWFRAIYGAILGQPIPTLPSPTSYKPIDWVSVLSAIQQLPNERLPKALPSLVIDEGQDMPLTFYRALVALGFSNFYVVADQNQQLHPDRCSTRQEIEGVLGLDVDDTIELKHNYRNPLPVALLARAFYTGDPASPPPELPAASESVWTPRLLHYGSQGDPSFEQIVARILKLSDRNRRKLVGVITPNNRIRERFVRALLEVDVDLDHGRPPIATYASGMGAELEFKLGGIMVLNAHSCKGLEFDIAMLADIDEHQPKNDEFALKSRFYVMVSRARERVFLLRTGEPCPVVERILPADPAILSRT